MAKQPDRPDKIAATLEEIRAEFLDAMRRAGVAERKREGYQIESVEAARLFNEATGYLLRLRDLRDDIRLEVNENPFTRDDLGRIMGHLDDYNRILADIKKNDSFKSVVENLEPIKSDWNRENRSYTFRVKIGDQQYSQEKKWGLGEVTTMRRVVLPRLIRLTKEVEGSLIGRCASGKTPD